MQNQEDNIEVMVSINVRTMKDSALKLKAFLEQHNIRTWVCVNMEAGVNYREEIVRAVKSCEIFIPLINDEWASSGECQDEYSLAKRLNLTSYEKEIAKPPQPRKPVILPIAFPNLVWDKYPHVELLAASTNFLVHDKASLLEGDTTQLFTNILYTVFPSLISFGINVHLLKEEMKNLGITLISENDSSTTKESKQQTPLSLIQQLQEHHHQQSLVMTALNNQMFNLLKDQKMEQPLHPDSELYSIKLLKERYLGTQVWTAGEGLIKGVDQFELTFKPIDEKIEEEKRELAQIEGFVIWKRIHVAMLPGGDESWFEGIKKSMTDNLTGTEQFSGTFNRREGVVRWQSSPFQRDEGADFALNHLCEVLLNHDGTLLSGFSKEDSDSASEPIRAKSF